MTPIVIFAYKRPDTTRRLLTSLLRCPECSESDLFVFLDGPKCDEDIPLVSETRNLFEDLAGFRNVNLTIAECNKGLAKSVIEGVTYVLGQYKDAIVLEDDLVVTSDFLSFMNQAIEMYRNRKDIWSISGYTPRLKLDSVFSSGQAFLVPRAQCWGWATWSDRWSLVDWQVSDFARMKSRKERKDFNRGGNDLFRTLDMERHGKIESWAIRWAYAAYRNKSLTVNPIGSKVQNIGFETEATHQGWHDSRHSVDLYEGPIKLSPTLQPDPILMDAFKSHHDLNLISKIGYFLRRYGLGYHTLKSILKHSK